MMQILYLRAKLYNSTPPFFIIQLQYYNKTYLTPFFIVQLRYSVLYYKRHTLSISYTTSLAPFCYTIQLSKLRPMYASVVLSELDLLQSLVSFLYSEIVRIYSTFVTSRDHVIWELYMQHTELVLYTSSMQAFYLKFKCFHEARTL